MSHVTAEVIHVYANRGTDIQIVITTSEDSGDFTSIAFRTSTGITKTGLSATGTATGFTVDVTIDAADVTETKPTSGQWELVATFNSEVRSLALGPFEIDPEPTSA